MPNLVGTGLNQVPTNSMLGGLAYQDPEHASIKNLDLKNLSQINAEISDTAVDVFVYDTRKDSDGGAWRKRTSHTSWYNETLGTATRGTRKEFPAVAVIVSASSPNRITIYDGDDPDLPMWIEFTSNSGQYGYLFNGRSAKSVVALDGQIVIADSLDSSGICNFISDRIHSVAVTGGYDSRRNVADRNPSDGVNKWYVSNSSIGLVGNPNDVAITVLPNAPIDIATGLPIPTIAVATESGVSVVRDDGNVVDLTGSDTYIECNNVFFSDYGKLLYDTEDTSVVYEVDIPSSDINYGAYNSTSNGRVIYPTGTHGGFSSGEIRLLGRNMSDGGKLITKGAFAFDANGASETINGLTLFDREESNPAFNSLLAFVASDYNTGWIHGDCKGAFLSDTSTTNAVELVTNGTFDSNANSWNSGDPSHVTVSQTGGVLQVTTTSGNDGSRYAYQQIDNVPPGTYRITATAVSNPSNRAILRIGTSDQASSGGGNAANILNSGYLSGSNQTSTHLFTTTSTSNIVISLFNDLSAGTGTWDNVKFHIAEEDRSVNNNPLQVFGTVTKSAVATGADLVAYSGFNASNHLLQPNNSDLQFGTGDLYMIFWHKKTDNSTNEVLFQTTDTTTGGSGATLGMQHLSGNYYAYTTGGSGGPGGTNDFLTGAFVTDGNWHCVAAVRSNGTLTIYVDGKNVGSGVRNYNVNNTGDLYIGSYSTAGTATAQTSTMALLRIGGSAPSAEQVKKIYEDEKCLFQENAKATLYGSSDAVTALAFDDTTNLLHVGTSAGRSEFQGLRRINNTTDAVTTAISASNGLVAEQ